MVVGPVPAAPHPAPHADVAGVVAAGVWRRFGSVEALRGVDVTARYGEVTGLVGPNGAGKTTLLLILATLLRPDAGTVQIAGHDPIRDTDAARAALGWVPDVFGVYDNLTVREYLRFAGAAYRMGRAAAVARADELVTLARLQDYADRPVHVLSRGQKQRLGFARSLVHRPRVLLLDEPAAGLDPYSRVELRDLLRRLAADGAAVMVSSHILADLEQTADRVVFVDHGVTVGERRMDDMARAGPRLWRVRALNPDILVAALDRHGYVHTPLSPAGVDVDLASDEAAAALVAGLVGDGVHVVTCAPLTSSLEATYLELTGEQG